MLKPFFRKGKTEAGCDEVGMGCLAGPVVAASVILPSDYYHLSLNDSKQLTPRQRSRIREDLLKDAVSWAIDVASSYEIDRLNILNASHLAMHRAIDRLKIRPELLLIDGNRFKPYKDTPHECIVKGDGKFYAIAAASVLAKTYRDDVMRRLAIEFPGYGWETNMGYPTRAHRKQIEEKGTTPHHRMSFQLLPR